MEEEKQQEIYKNLFDLFGYYHPLTESLKNDIFQKSEIIHVNRKTILLETGKPSKYIYFIASGAIRIYYLDKQGKETTSWLLSEGNLAISVFSFFTGKSSFEALQTLEDCVLIRLHRDSLEELYSKHLEFNIIGRKLTEHYYIKNEEQSNNLRMLTASERYQKLLTDNPSLINRFPLGYIASLLGMSQETLSRIRNF